jgi:hypothetical protein
MYFRARITAHVLIRRNQKSPGVNFPVFFKKGVLIKRQKKGVLVKKQKKRTYKKQHFQRAYS